MTGKKFQNKKLKLGDEKPGDVSGFYCTKKVQKTRNVPLFFRTVPLFFILVLGISPLRAEEAAREPIIVNGDTVEYETDGKKVTATGNVEVDYKDAKLTCQKLTVNTETKVGEATGDVRLEDKKGVIEGERAIYNFNNKSGTIFKANFRSNPYFGRAPEVKKISDAEFIAQRGYMSTCGYDRPHYRIKSKKIDFFPQDKVQTRGNTFYIGQVPVAYLPRYNHSLKDPVIHLQVLPGKKRDWGLYVLNIWRYNLTENVIGRVYFDYREKRGVAEGFGVNYTTHKFGKGDYKYYYMQERARNFDEGVPAEFQRYFIRWRHKWDVDRNTELTAEYYEINDSKRALHGTQYNFLKDYFYREYEKDNQPLTYLQVHRRFTYSSLDLLMQKRTNRWYDSYLEKLPEIKYELSAYRMNDDSPFYFSNSSSAANLNLKRIVHSTSPDVHVNRFDTTNKFSLPMKVAFFKLNPYVSGRETFYDRDVDKEGIPPRTVFYSGTDLSTKFYRIFNVKSGFLGMDINGLRHIITPTAGYSYNHEPTIGASHLRQLDGVDSITRSNSASLALYNKLQTKRKNQSVDFVNSSVSSSYIFKPKTGDKRGSNLTDILFDLRILPYSWMSIDADATYKHSGDRAVSDYKRFSNASYDVNFIFSEERSFGLGQSYQRRGGNVMTNKIDWRLNPKWKFSLYHMRNLGHTTGVTKGLREQEYSIIRNLHCWDMKVTYNVKRAEGESIWFIFTLKAFPETEFGFNTDYHRPKPGSQGYH